MPVPNSIEDLNPVASENYPAGSEQVFPNLDNYLRAHAAYIAQLRDELRVVGLPIGASIWWGGARSALPTHLVPEDGQLVNRADYPQLWALVSAGGYPIVSESEWQADKAKRGSFSSGDGSTTFRFPDNNGKATGSYGSTVKRGDGAGSAGAPGLIQDSQNKEHTHTGSTSQTGAHTHSVSGATDAAGAHEHANGSNYRVALAGGGWDGWAAGNYGNRATSSAGSHSHSVTGSAASAGSHSHTVTINSQGGTEARGISVTGCHVMRVK